MSIEEEFQGPGERFVRMFLLVVVLVIGCLLALAVTLSWHFGMDVTVEGQGVIEPRKRRQVKTQIAGIIQEVHVVQGEPVASGQVLVTLDAGDWRAELQRIEKDLAINRSQQREIGLQIDQEREIRQSEVAEARLAVEEASVQLEQVVAEQEIYYMAPLLLEGLSRKPLEELLPVRLGDTVLRQREANLKRTETRLRAIEGRRQELRTLEKRRERLAHDRHQLNHRLAQNTIRAPMGGTVLTADLARRVGDHLEPGEVILEVAKTDKWQAWIRVKEMDLPKIEVGQPARLYIDAFPHMEYKVFEAMVEELPTAPVEVSPIEGVVYAVRVLIEDPQVGDDDWAYSLTYGMNAKAKITVDRGRILELLWKKILQMGGRVGRHDFHPWELELETATDSLENGNATHLSETAPRPHGASAGDSRLTGGAGPFGPAEMPHLTREARRE